MISWTLLYITLHIFEYISKLWVRLKAQLEMDIRNAHIRSVNFCVTMIVFNQDLPRQVILRNSEFYESKMYLVWKLWLLSCSYITPTQFFRIFLISSLFHNFIFIYIWWIADISPLSQCCSNDSQKGKWKNEHRRNREKKEEKLDISIPNREIRFLNFLRFIAFTILGTFKNFVIKPEALVLCHNIKKFADLWRSWGSIYEAKLIMYRSSHP